MTNQPKTTPAKRGIIGQPISRRPALLRKRDSRPLRPANGPAILSAGDVAIVADSRPAGESSRRGGGECTKS